LYRWVVKNIKYSYDSYTPILPTNIEGTLKWREDYWRMPAETLSDGHGDCEDMALLLASMIHNYNNKNYGLYVVTISDANKLEGHAAVLIPVKDDNLAIFDPAGKYYTGYRSGDIQTIKTSAAITDWLNYWNTDLPGAYIDSVFSENLYKNFSSTQEFLSWYSQQYR
jgi:hypothetical protein